MEQKKWYRFWKKSGPMQFLTEDYKLYPAEYDFETVESCAEHWATQIGGGFNTHYKYGLEEIEKPPKEWMDKEIEIYRKRKKEIENYLNFLKKY